MNMFFKVKEQQENLEEAHKHMEEAMKQFKTYEETPDADSSTVADFYLEVLDLNLDMPDMSRLEKPAKPPVPQVIFGHFGNFWLFMVRQSGTSGSWLGSLGF